METMRKPPLNLIKRLSTSALLILILILAVNIASANVIDRGATWDLTDNGDGTIAKTYYMGTVNVPDQNGKYEAFNDLITHSIDTDTLFIEAVNSDITLQFIALNPGNQPMPIESVVGFNLGVTEYRGVKKWAYDLQLPNTQFKAKVYMTTELPLVLYENDAVSDNIKISFKDVLKYNYTYTVEKINDYNAVFTIEKDWGSHGINQGDMITIDPTATYDFNVQTNIQAWEEEGCDDGPRPPADGPDPSCGGAHNDITTDSDLDASDDNVVFLNFGSGDKDYWLFNITVQETISEITLLNFSTETGDGDEVINGIEQFIWNFTGSSWISCGDHSNGADTWLSCNYTSAITDLINSSGSLWVILQLDNTFPTVSFVSLDYVTLEITYDGIIINTLTDDQQILNNLSTVLNTTATGYTNATWYTWNGGIINTTLCQPPGPCTDNQTQITFPRRGLFNLTVYANNSAGTITSDTASNLFVGNFTQVFFDSFQNHNNWSDDANNDWDTIGCSPAGCAHGDNFNPSRINLTTAVDLSSYSESDNVNVSFQYKEAGGTLEGDDCVNYHLWDGGSWTNDIEIFCDDIGFTYLNFVTTLNSSYLVSGFKFRFEGESFTASNEDVYIDNFNISSITLNSENTPPNVTAVTTNRTNFTSTSANLTFNVTDDNDYLLNASLYIDSSYNSSVLTNIARNISLNFTKTFVSGTYTWFVRSYDTDLRFNDSDIFTFKINSPPTLTSVELNKTSGVVATDDLNCTVVGLNDVDGEQTPRLEFEWYNNSVAEGINDSRLDNGNLTNNEEWYCEAWATDGFLNSSKFTSSTVNVSSSQSAPALTSGNATTALTNINSTAANPTNNNSWINFTWEFTDPNTDEWTGYVCDTPNFGVCSANASGEVLCKSSNNITNKLMSCRINASGYSGGNPETVYAFVQDNGSLVSSSRSTTFEINHPPSVPTIVSPVNNSFIATNYTIINYTATDSNSDVINFTIYNSTDDVTYFIANSSNLTFFNWTDLSDGTYYTRAFSTDEHSYSFNTNSSISQFTVDTLTPTLSVTSPTNGTTYRSTTLSLIISATDTNLDSCNYTLIFADVGSVSSSGSANCTGGTAVSTPFYNPGYNITISVNDSAGNINTTTINFFAIALSGGGGGGGGGGGPAPSPPPPVIDLAKEIKKEIEEAIICGNGICQASEGPLTCPGDCPPDLGAILCPITGGTDCPAWVFSYMLYGLGGFAAFFTLRRQAGIPTRRR